MSGYLLSGCIIPPPSPCANVGAGIQGPGQASQTKAWPSTSWEPTPSPFNFTPKAQTKPSGGWLPQNQTKGMVGFKNCLVSPPPGLAGFPSLLKPHAYQEKLTLGNIW